MLKKTITYKNYNDEEVSEDFYFHLSKAELVELELSHEGGLEQAIQRIARAQDGKAIINEFKKIILGAYGERSADGRRFTKTQALRDEFESTEAYSTLFMELVTNADTAAEFIRGVIPQDLAEEAAKAVAAAPVLAEAPVPVLDTDDTTIHSYSKGQEPKEVKIVTQAELREMNFEDTNALMARIAAGEARLMP